MFFFRCDRYDNAPTTGLPGAIGSPDPGPGVPNLSDINGFSILTPAIVDIAPDATRSVPLTFVFQNNASGINIAFLNNVVRGFPHFLFFFGGIFRQQNSLFHIALGIRFSASRRLYWLTFFLLLELGSSGYRLNPPRSAQKPWSRTCWSECSKRWHTAPHHRGLYSNS